MNRNKITAITIIDCDEFDTNVCKMNDYHAIIINKAVVFVDALVILQKISSLHIICFHVSSIDTQSWLYHICD